MKVPTLMVLFAAAAMAAAQTAATPAQTPTAPAPTRPQTAMPAESNVPLNAPVITLKMPCAPTAAKPGARTLCTRTITRAEFETLAKSLNPNMPPSVKRQLAQAYARMLAVESEAKRLGVDRDPAFQQRLNFGRLQILAQEFTQTIDRKFSVLPPAEIQKYYDDNKERYEELELKRIFVPRTAASSDLKPEQLEELARQLRERAAKGEDMDALQKEAYTAIKAAGTPPTTAIGPRRRGSLPPAHEAQVFALKQDEVSPLYSEPSGFFIYKVVSKTLVPLSSVRAEIQRNLQQQRVQDAIQSLFNTANAQLNESYFAGEDAVAPDEVRPATPPPAARPQTPPAQQPPVVQPQNPAPQQPK